jgi:hypothetical protein
VRSEKEKGKRKKEKGKRKKEKKDVVLFLCAFWVSG